MSAPFQIGDRVRIVTNLFAPSLPAGSEWTVSSTESSALTFYAKEGQFIGVDGFNGGNAFLLPSELVLVERAS